MLLLFPQGGSSGTVSVGVSDTLGVRITETPVNDFYIDTPDTLRVAIVDTSANAAAFSRTDTLSVRIADSSSVLVSGTTAIAGTDTLSITITDATGNLAVAIAVTDTLSVQITDSGSVATTQAAKAGTDTLAVALSDSAFINSVGTVEQVAGDIISIRFEDSGAVLIPTRVERINFYPKKGSIRFSAL